MKLAKTVTGFNPELIGTFVKIVGIDIEGEPVEVKGIIKRAATEKIVVATVYTDYSKERADMYERDFYFSEFFENTEAEDQAFYELYVYAEAIPAELDKP